MASDINWEAMARDLHRAVSRNQQWCECSANHTPEFQAWLDNGKQGTMPTPTLTTLCPRCRAMAQYERVAMNEEWNAVLDEIEIKALGKVTTR